MFACLRFLSREKESYERKRRHGGLQKAAPHAPHGNKIGFCHRITAHPAMGIGRQIAPTNSLLGMSRMYFANNAARLPGEREGRLFGAPRKFSLWRTVSLFQKRNGVKKKTFPDIAGG